MALVMAADKRGPKLGDAASLWNFTPSPGWTKDEAATLKLALMHLGVGKWKEIQESGLLPGKMVQQLNGQTQRLLGQQSLAAYTGLKVDIDRVRTDNEAKAGPGVERKGGLIINAGRSNPTKEMRAAAQAEARATYGLTDEQAAAVAAEFEERVAEAAAARAAAAGAAAVAAAGAGGSAAPAGSSGACGPAAGGAPLLMGSDPAVLPRGAKLALLARLHARAAALKAEVARAERGGGAGPGPATTAAAAAAAPPAAAPPPPPPPQPSSDVPMADAAATVAAAAPAAAQPGAAKKAAPPRPRSANGGGASAPAAKRKKKAPSAAAARRAAAVAQVVAMGFPKAKAVEALAEAHGDVAGALEWLLAHCL